MGYSALLQRGYIDFDGTPLKCKKCKHECFIMEVLEWDDKGNILEFAQVCTKCKANNGIWSGGAWVH